MGVEVKEEVKEDAQFLNLNSMADGGTNHLNTTIGERGWRGRYSELCLGCVKCRGLM